METIIGMSWMHADNHSIYILGHQALMPCPSMGPKRF